MTLNWHFDTRTGTVTKCAKGTQGPCSSIAKTEAQGREEQVGRSPKPPGSGPSHSLTALSQGHWSSPRASPREKLRGL